MAGAATARSASTGLPILVGSSEGGFTLYVGPSASLSGPSAGSRWKGGHAYEVETYASGDAGARRHEPP